MLAVLSILGIVLNGTTPVFCMGPSLTRGILHRLPDSLVEIHFGLLIFRQLAHFNHAAALRLGC
jgi:hypothetical protein